MRIVGVSAWLAMLHNADMPSIAIQQLCAMIKESYQCSESLVDLVHTDTQLACNWCI